MKEKGCILIINVFVGEIYYKNKGKTATGVPF
jgi:hypothetical protein